MLSRFYRGLIILGLVALGFAATTCPTNKHVFGDGSDPMPLCRPTPTNPCKGGH